MILKILEFTLDHFPDIHFAQKLPVQFVISVGFSNELHLLSSKTNPSELRHITKRFLIPSPQSVEHVDHPPTSHLEHSPALHCS